jgi:hypothetical protein
MKHNLVRGTLVADDKGVVATCTCGWNSGHRFSGLIASAAFMDHQEEAEAAERERADKAQRTAGGN